MISRIEQQTRSLILLEIKIFTILHNFTQSDLSLCHFSVFSFLMFGVTFGWALDEVIVRQEIRIEIKLSKFAQVTKTITRRCQKREKDFYFGWNTLSNKFPTEEVPLAAAGAFQN